MILIVAFPSIVILFPANVPSYNKQNNGISVRTIYKEEKLTIYTCPCMDYDVVVVGSGFGSLTAAALLAKRGLKVCVLEQAKYAGGCASSFKRKGYWFETGATTLVGLDLHMPLRYLLDETGITLPVRKLEKPMQVHLPNGQLLTRYQELEEWIGEAERVFGKYNQRAFWEHCYKVSKAVWHTSLQQQSFPPSNAKDLAYSALHTRPAQLKLIPAAFRTMDDVLRKYKLLDNNLFVDFVNEQLLITAQNYLHEVNELFGATALCYTLYNNYNLDGGLINMVKPVVNYILDNGGDLQFGQEVQAISSIKEGYKVTTAKNTFQSKFIISGIPLHNTAELFSDEAIKQRLQPYLLPSAKQNGAFTMGLVLKQQKTPEVLHHQVHVPQGLPIIGSKSIFVSFSHPADDLRAPAGEVVASVSTHIPDPAQKFIEDKVPIEKAILAALQQQELIQQKSISYSQSATPGAWTFWTKRAYGAVGGYPHYKSTKPWQMKDARLDHRGAYVCGDTVYPGQGIVGVCLSGIIAAHKLVQDHF
ncbi:phytoene desaturase family protein [Pontibacter harenae]|uniref:phytoene desaturase family protein n=1 Tax=Pontibacter harenae TaxID=2894083 RepID=UPI001E61D61F|nr:NAD(P)/FAD-dependent oxidoreductase [Pontibacter harenae]MCC9165593.1 NAD(P)/FAD-dependent oxidoreductase [Pontibacter harenae]